MPVLTKRELADELGRSTQWVNRQMAEGMPNAGFNSFGRRLFDLEICVAWLAEHSVRPKPEALEKPRAVTPVLDRNRLDNAPFVQLAEETIKQTHSSISELAHWAGMDPERLRVALGLKSYRKHGREYTQRSVNYETAVRLVKACNAWPTDYGV